MEVIVPRSCVMVLTLLTGEIGLSGFYLTTMFSILGRYGNLI